MSNKWEMQPPPTPAKVETMPQASIDQEVAQEMMLSMAAQNSLLKTKNNRLQEKVAELNRIIAIMERREN